MLKLQACILILLTPLLGTVNAEADETELMCPDRDPPFQEIPWSSADRPDLLEKQINGFTKEVGQYLKDLETRNPNLFLYSAASTSNPAGLRDSDKPIKSNSVLSELFDIIKDYGPPSEDGTRSKYMKVTTMKGYGVGISADFSADGVVLKLVITSDSGKLITPPPTKGRYRIRPPLPDDEQQ